MKGKKLLCALLALALAAGLCMPAAASAPAAALHIIAPEDWELGVGKSRTLDYVFTDDAETHRALTWASGSPAVATVDEWGRVTGVTAGTSVITATQVLPQGGTASPLTASVTVTVTGSAAAGAPHASVVNYAGAAEAEVKNLQKVVTRWATDAAKADSAVPDAVKTAIDAADKSPYASAATADGAVWTITAYGVKRAGGIAATTRDQTMRFMGDRYFYEADTTAGKVLAILPDGGNGVWTIMATGVTHIAMVSMTAADKAEVMSENTQQYVSRRGMVSEANLVNGTWIPQETDNDGLWTAMYGAGELFRYASLKRALAYNPLNADLQRQVAEAKETATLSTEAVLLLANISMRGGDVETVVKHFADSGYTANAAGSWPLYNDGGKDLPAESLVKGGDPSVYIPSGSPSLYTYSSAARRIAAVTAADWSADAQKTYAARTRSLGGFIARTYSVEGEPGYSTPTGGVYYSFANYSAANKQAAGLSTNESKNGLSMNISVDASGTIPARLYNDILAANGVDLTKVVYKGDTSTDEVIGHLFLYKIAYDVFKDSDPELAQIIATTMDNFAQHLSDNEYMLIDAAGQPTTWGKMNRQYFYTYRWGASSSPLTAGVLLCAFKTAAYVTGDQKWENEYELLLKEGAYLYGGIMATHTARDEEFLNNYAGAMLYSMLGTTPLTAYFSAQSLSAEKSFLMREFAQYSDEEMAMLAFYLLFQMETETSTLAVYRTALDQWWSESVRYSENPLWYYIYQLAYPTRTDLKDAYGNSILETAAWSLSRHPIDTRKWLASNDSRDDIVNIDLENYGLDTRGGLTFDKTAYLSGAQFPTPDGQLTTTQQVIGALLQGYVTQGAIKLVPAVAAPDERALHKYNGPAYTLASDHSPGTMEGSTTYTLPYWMGVYHGMLALSEFAYVSLPETPKTPVPASSLFDDVAASDWFHGAVTYTADQGLFEGTGERTFSPQEPMTRGMLITALWRLAGKPDAAGTEPFTDVTESDWFSTPVRWAWAAKIVDGVTDTEFRPAQSITREQLAAMLYRYARSRGTTAAGKDYSSFADADQVDAYAAEAVSWAVATGLMEGRDGNRLVPRGLATRAEAAAIFLRFSKL